MELIEDLLPPGVVNVVQGFGVEAGKPLASSNRIAKVGFTGETTTWETYHAICIRKPYSSHTGIGW
jgi:acyl-CoA reductase-like NAD-dependent aldehyde dehydrogenase